MKAGDTKTIFEEPLTEERPEGEAILLNRDHLSHTDGVFEWWYVQFISDGFSALRKIKKEAA